MDKVLEHGNFREYPGFVPPGTTLASAYNANLEGLDVIPTLNFLLQFLSIPRPYPSEKTAGEVGGAFQPLVIRFLVIKKAHNGPPLSPWQASVPPKYLRTMLPCSSI